MTLTWIMLVKYLSWMLTVGTAFVGSWFFEYTTTDKETGRKKLTAWGRRGIVLAGLALASSLGLTLWTDYEAAQKQKSAEENAMRDRASTAENQHKLTTALTDMKTLLEAIKAAPLSDKDRVAIDQTVVNLAGIEDYKKHFPDLFKRIMEATTFQDVSSAVNEGLGRAVALRISNSPECASVPRTSTGPMPGGYPGGGFKLGGAAVISYLIMSDGVKFGFADYSDLKSLGQGSYRFVFSDGSQSNDLKCTEFRSSMSCDDNTSVSEAKAVYRDLQTKQIAEIRTDKSSYPVTSSIAADMKRTFSCVSP